MSQYRSDADVERRVATRSRNLTLVGVLLMLSGALSIVQGVIALTNDTYFTIARQSIFQTDPTGWGWVQLLGGLVVLGVGVAVLRRAPWARPVAVVLALLSMAVSFMWFPGHIFWAMLVIAVDGLVIGAVTAPGAFDRDE